MATCIFVVSVVYCSILITNAQANLTTVISNSASFYGANMTSIAVTNSTGITKAFNTTINTTTASTIIKIPTLSNVFNPVTSIAATIIPTITMIVSTTGYFTGKTPSSILKYPSSNTIF